MKILYISAAAFPSEKSHSLSIMRVCQALSDAGNEVTLFGQSSDLKPFEKDPIGFYGLRGGFSVLTYKLCRLCKTRLFRVFLIDGLISAWKTRKLFKRLKPDIVYSRLTVAELLLVPARLPVIYEMHSLGPLGQQFIRRAAFVLLTKIKNFRKLVVTTDFLAEIMMEKFPNIPVIVARLSADLPAKFDLGVVDNFRKKQLKGSNFVHHVGYTGYLDNRGLRGTDIIIKCAFELPEVAFHIVGGETEMVEYWRKYSEQYNKNKNIFFYGHRNPSEIPYFLHCFDITLAPLQHRPSKRAPNGENMSPLKLPQYLSYGKVIVASDIPAHRECLTANETALLVLHDNITEWVKAINALLYDLPKRQAMSQKAILAFFAGYTHEMRIKNILSGLEA